jgi:hypothetical protein
MYDLLFHSHKAFQCVLHLNFGYASLFKHAFIKVLFLYKFCLHFSHVIIEAIFFKKFIEFSFSFHLHYNILEVDIS